MGIGIGIGIAPIFKTSPANNFLLYATFTAPDAVQVVTYTPEVGGPFLIGRGSDHRIYSNRATAWANIEFSNYADVGEANVIIDTEVVLRLDQIGILCRYQDNANFWRCVVIASTGYMYIQEYTAGNNNRASVNIGAVSGDHLHLRVTLNGNDITFKVTGDRTGTVTYSSPVGAARTKHGIYAYGSGGERPQTEWISISPF